MTTNIERAADVLRDDKYYKMWPHGEQFLTSEAARSLADAGLLMPDLPDFFGEADAMAVTTGEIVTVAYWGYSAQVEAFGGKRGRGVTLFGETVENPRELALWLIAAANHAEQEQSND